MAIDRRIRKTKHAIKQAFIQLLEQKELDSITISDITESADINRGTFYLHYEDKYDLLEKMENEYAEVLYDQTRSTALLKSAESVDEFFEVFSNQVLKNVMTHIYDNLDFYQVILTLERKSQLEERMYQIILDNMKERMDEEGQIAGIPVMYFHSYVSGSMAGIVKHWVTDEQRVDVDTLIQYVSRIVFNGPVRLMAMSQDEKNRK